MNDDDDDFLDDEVDDIISQIRNQSKNLKESKAEHPDLIKDNLEEFIIVNAGKVVNHSLEMVENLKLEVQAGADSKLIESISELIKATTSAIDSLSKLKIADDKIKAQKEITQMNIDSKTTKDDENNNSTPRLSFTRSEILKLMEKQEVIDI